MKSFFLIISGLALIILGVTGVAPSFFKQIHGQADQIIYGSVMIMAVICGLFTMVQGIIKRDEDRIITVKI